MYMLGLYAALKKEEPDLMCPNKTSAPFTVKWVIFAGV